MIVLQIGFSEEKKGKVYVGVIQHAPSTVLWWGICVERRGGSKLRHEDCRKSAL